MSNVYKRANEPELPAGKQLNGRTQTILYFMEIVLFEFSQLLIWRKGAHLKTCSAGVINYVEIMKQMFIISHKKNNTTSVKCYMVYIL